MPEENYQIVIGLIITMVVLLIAAAFIFILVTYSNKRKKLFLQEKQNLQLLFNQQLLQSQIETQEQTFQHLSREIHDNVGQILSLAKVQLNIMEEGKTFNQPLLTDVKESVGKAMIDLRDIAKSLNTDRIKLCSLAEMTNHELQRIARLGTIKTFFTAQGQEQPIDEQKKLIVFRMIQEALQNILKHAGAQTIEVAFKYDSRGFNCEIKDDGKGFDPALINSKEGLGLQNLVSRAALIGGQSNIQTGINKGTIITIVLPYE
jgi:two-component system, NarL family, sensor kinase